MAEPDDLGSMLIELVARTCWGLARMACALVVFAIRVPGVLPLLIAEWVLLRYAGLDPALWTTFAFAIGLVVWRVAWPASYARRARPVLARVWKTPVYRLWWPHVAARTGLVAHNHGHGRTDAVPQRPHLAWVKVTRTGVEELGIGLPVGLTPDDVAARVDAIAHAFRAREARIAPAKPGGVIVQLHRRDVLARTIRPLPVPESPSLRGVPVGLAEDGTPWRFQLTQTHVLIAGATGAGKGSILWSLLSGLSRAIDQGWVQVWAVDPKGGMELRPGKRLFSRFEDGTPETMASLLEDLVAVMDDRATMLAGAHVRQHTPTPDAPHVVLLLDELATLTAFAERTVARRIEQALGLLLTKGRAVGITVVAAVQDPGKDIVTWRDLIPTRIAMRLDNPIQVDMVLGEGARDLGATADRISEHTPGVAYVRLEGTRAIARVRAAYLTDADIDALAETVTAKPALRADRPVSGPGRTDEAPGWPVSSTTAPAGSEPGARPARKRSPRASVRPRNEGGDAA